MARDSPDREIGDRLGQRRREPRGLFRNRRGMSNIGNLWRAIPEYTHPSSSACYHLTEPVACRLLKKVLVRSLTMKTQLIKPITVLAVAALSFASIYADDGFRDQDDDCQRGGQVDGSEELEQEVRLKGTEEAPRGARGKAELEVGNEDGVTTGTLKIETKGLLEGAYTVAAISASAGTETVLGTFDVTARRHDDGNEDDQGEDDDDDGDHFAATSGFQSFDSDDDDGDDQGEDHHRCERGTFGGAVFGDGTSIPFPEGFNPLDIAEIEITDANGAIVLTGDFTNPKKSRHCHLNCNVQVTPGEAAPGAAGTAALRVKARKRIVRQKFVVNAENVPAGTTLTVNVNGQPAGKVRTRRSGKVTLRGLPRGVAGHRVYSVSFDDANGNRVLSAKF